MLAAVSATTLAACSVPAPPRQERAAALPRQGLHRLVDRPQSDVRLRQRPRSGRAPRSTLKTPDIYTPTGDTQTSRPAMIWVHGGAFAAGDKAKAPYPKLANEFAQRGYVALSINYRLMSTESARARHPPRAAKAAASTPSTTPRRRTAACARTRELWRRPDPHRARRRLGRRGRRAPGGRPQRGPGHERHPGESSKVAAWSRSPASCRPRARRCSAGRRADAVVHRHRGSAHPRRERCRRPTPARSTTRA